MSVGAEEFAALMAPLGPFPHDRRVLVAVSGGADSMALAVLLSRWGAPLACIVDHGLRPDSAAEADLAARRLSALGVPAMVRRAGLAPGPAAAERARAARYALLLDACRDAGCADLVLAHHADDQAETVKMRQEAGSAAPGLAGMAALAFRNEARLLRPLLCIPPARLRATLQASGVAWVEDPTNRDRRTARGRLRALMDRATYRSAMDVAIRHGAGRRDFEQHVAEELAAVRFHPEGFAVVPHPLGDAALAAVIWAVSGRRYPPPRAALQAGLDARTAHGVLLRAAGRLGSGTLVAREPQAVAAPSRARAGLVWAGLVWDSRFRLAGTPAPGLSVGALGADAARFRRVSALPSIVLRTLPALRRGQELVAVPHLAFPDAQTCRSVAVWFCPTRPAAGAPFVPAAVNPREGQGM